MLCQNRTEITCMEIRTKYEQEMDRNFAFNNMMSKYGEMERYDSVILEKKFPHFGEFFVNIDVVSVTMHKHYHFTGKTFCPERHS